MQELKWMNKLIIFLRFFLKFIPKSSLKKFRIGILMILNDKKCFINKLSQKKTPKVNTSI